MKRLKVIIGCERSGEVRRAFRALGYDAWSIDLEPADDNSEFHITANVLDTLDRGWDLGIFFPDCTYLTVSVNGPITHGCSLYTAKEGQRRRRAAIKFFRQVADAPIPRVAVENPIGIMSTVWRKPDQIIQPYHFGEDASKSTCLWLRGLLPLAHGRYVKPRMVCDECKGVYEYQEVFSKGCPHCGAEPGRAKPRWANQTDSGQNKLPPSKNRAYLRAKTYPGIAAAMAKQWSNIT